MLRKTKVVTTKSVLVANLMWQILGEYCSLYQNISPLPFQLSMSNKEVRVTNFTTKGRIVSGSSATWMLAHTLACGYFLVSRLLLTKSSISNSDAIDNLEIFVNIYFLIFPLCLVGMSVTIAFYPQVAPNILNRIVEFEGKLEGNFFKTVFHSFSMQLSKTTLS